MNDKCIVIETRDLGTIEIPESNIISFPNGIYAFEDIKSFVAISPLGESIYPMWLQAVERPSLCFIVYSPSEIIPDYKLDIDDNDLASIGYEDGNDICTLAIASIPENNFKKTTVNLKSPIVVNKTKMLAAQVILEEDYLIRHPLFSDEKEGD